MNEFNIRMIFDTFFLINQAFYWVNLVINGFITGQKMVCDWSVYDYIVTVFCPVGCFDIEAFIVLPCSYRYGKCRSYADSDGIGI